MTPLRFITNTMRSANITAVRGMSASVIESAPFATPAFLSRAGEVKRNVGGASESVRLSTRLGRTGVTYRRYDRKRIEAAIANYDVYVEKGLQDPRLPIP
eukprot:CFRG1600T1